jgi:hypothetical protein
MSEPRQDSPTDPQLSRLYRQYSTSEPSHAADERILLAARAAVSGLPRSARSTGWWRRWRTPLALATTLVLSLALALLHERPPGDLPSERSPDQEVVKATGKESRPSLTASDQNRPVPALAPAPEEVQSAAVAATSGRQAAAMARTAPPAAPARERDSRARPDVVAEQGTPAVAEKKAVSVARSPEEKLESAPAPAAAIGDVTGNRDRARFDATPAGAQATAPATAKSRAEAVRTASAWLDEIRALRRAGKSQEAERQLGEFRRANPDYPLPEEFRQ